MPRPRSHTLFALALVLPAGAQTIVWRGNNAAWSTAAEWAGDIVPGATDTAQVSGGIASVNSAATVGRLLLSGGTVGGSATLTLSSTSAASGWSAGTLMGTGTLRIATGASLELSGSANKIFGRGDGNGFGGRTIENLGTFKLDGTGNLLGGDGAQFLNQAGGTFLLNGDLTVGHSGSGNAALFTNAGTFRKSAGTATATVSGTVFTTSGRVEALAGTGTLAFTSGVTSNGGVFDAGTGARIAFSGGQTFNTGTAFTGAGTVSLDGGTTTVDGTLSSQNLVFAGGDLRGTATVSGALAWTGGDWVGTGTIKIASGATLSLSGSANKRFLRNDGNGFGGRIIENLGEIVWTGTGQLQGGDGAQIVNQSTGRFLIQTAGTLAHTGSGNLPTFTNSGIVRQTATTGLTTIAVPFVNQAGGSVDIQSGSLVFTNSVTSTGGAFVTASGSLMKFTGGQSFGHGTSFTATGPISITSGDTTLSGTIAAGGLEFGGGSLYGGASVTGAMSWTGGLWRGADTLMIASGGTLTASGAATKTLDRGDGNGFGGRIVQVGGTLKWIDAGTLAASDGAGISVSGGGVFEIRNDSTYTHGGSGNLAKLTNAGTVRKLASTGTTTFTSVEFANTGTLELASGKLELTGAGGLANGGIVTLAAGTQLISSAGGATSDGGTFDLAAGSLLKFTAGTNTLANTSITGGGVATVDGGTLLVSTTDLSAKLSLVSGTIGGSGTLSVGTGGSFAWSGGAMTGTGTLLIGGTGLMSIDGPDAKSFYRGDGNGFGGRSISNFGTVTWSGTGSILGGDGAQFSNQIGALFEITGDAKFGHNGSGNAVSFVNAGGVRKSAGTGTTEFAQSVTNTGTIESKSGTILLSGGGAGSGQFKANGGELTFSGGYTLDPGARFFGPNFIRLTSGALTVPTGEAAVGSGSLGGLFSLQGGFLGGAGTFLIDALGRMEWTSGALRDTGTLKVASGGELRILGAADHTFHRGDGNGFGGRTIDNYGTIAWTGGALLGGDGAQIVNRNGALFSIDGGTTLGHTGSGNGLTFTNAGTFRKSGTGFLSVSGSFINSGVVEVVAGNLNFNLGVTSNAGKFETSSGATLTFAGGQSFNDGTRFIGFGTAQVAAGDTQLAGTITADYFRFSGGRIFGSATLDGYFEWAGGTFVGANTLNLTSGTLFLITGTGDRDFSRGDGNGFGGRVIDNSGFILVENAGDLRGGDGAQLINRSSGFVVLYNDRAITHTGSGNLPSITNQGDFVKSDGSGTNTVAVPFHNDGGTLGVYSAGTLAFTSTFTNTNGSVVLANGGRLTVPGLLDLGSGSLTGNGTVVAPGGVKSNGALFVDQLSIVGDLTLLASASLQFMLGTPPVLVAEADGGPGSFTRFAASSPSLTVTGQVTLGGSLQVFVYSGATISPTDTFTLLNTSALLAGSFTNVASGQRLTIHGMGSFLVSYGGPNFGSSIVLSDFQAIPEPSTYALLALGAGLILFLQRRRTRR